MKEISSTLKSAYKIAKTIFTEEQQKSYLGEETDAKNQKSKRKQHRESQSNLQKNVTKVNHTTIEINRQMRREKIPSKSMNTQIKNYLMHHYEFRRNIVANTIEYCVPNITDWETLREADLIGELLDEGFKSVEQSLTTFLGSSQVIDYDPFIGYFESLPEWDGVDYIGQLAKYVVAEDVNWWNTMFRKALVRNCACATGFVNSNKQCLVLLGGSDTGKSMFIRFLVPQSLHQYFNENPNIGSKDDKDARLSIAKNFITHLDDIGNISESELKELKSIFSRESVNERLPYARTNTILPRKTTFWGTTDKDEFLIDERGNIRWVVVPIMSILHDGGGKKGYSQNVNMDKVWTQAYALLKNGFQFTLTLDEIEYSERNNTKNHMKRTMEEELIFKYYAPATRDIEKSVFLTATDITLRLEELSKKTTLRNVGIALKKLGYKRVSCVFNGKDVRGYFVLQLIGIV
jgi:hypothetical protein